MLMESRLNSALDSIHVLQSSFDRLSVASLSASGSLEERLEALSAALLQERHERQQESTQNEERIKRLRSKVREFAANLSVVTSVRERIDQILEDMNGKKLADDDRLKRLTSSVERTQAQMAEVSTRATRLRDDFKSKLALLEDKIGFSDSSSSTSLLGKQVSADIQQLKSSVASQEKSIAELNQRIKDLTANSNSKLAPSKFDTDAISKPSKQTTGGALDAATKVVTNEPPRRTRNSFDSEGDDDLLEVNSVHSKSSEDDTYDFKVSETFLCVSKYLSLS